LSQRLKSRTSYYKLVPFTNMTAVRKKQILIVDDDPDALHELRTLLEDRGFSVEVAQNGREALDQLLSNPTAEPALILLDLGMPVMDGWELLAIMRSYFRLRNIPVVLLSAHQVSPDSKAIFEAVFRKPIAPDALIDTVSQICTS
jgi:CheY-like chemotaxis protein